jgi:hypothetical protein
MRLQIVLDRFPIRIQLVAILWQPKAIRTDELHAELYRLGGILEFENSCSGELYPKLHQARRTFELYS